MTLTQQATNAEYKYTAYGNNKNINSLDGYRYLVLTVAMKNGSTWFQLGSVMGSVSDFITGLYLATFLYNVLQDNTILCYRPQAVFRSKTSVALQMYSGASGVFKLNLYGIK